MLRSVTGHLSEGSFVRNGVVQIPKFDTKPNLNPNPMRIRFGQMTLRTSELFPFVLEVELWRAENATSAYMVTPLF